MNCQHFIEEINTNAREAKEEIYSSFSTHLKTIRAREQCLVDQVDAIRLATITQICNDSSAGQLKDNLFVDRPIPKMVFFHDQRSLNSKLKNYGEIVSDDQDQPKRNESESSEWNVVKEDFCGKFHEICDPDLAIEDMDFEHLLKDKVVKVHDFCQANETCKNIDDCCFDNHCCKTAENFTASAIVNLQQYFQNLNLQSNKPTAENLDGLSFNKHKDSWENDENLSSPTSFITTVFESLNGDSNMNETEAEIYEDENPFVRTIQDIFENIITEETGMCDAPAPKTHWLEPVQLHKDKSDEDHIPAVVATLTNIFREILATTSVSLYKSLDESFEHEGELVKDENQWRSHQRESSVEQIKEAFHFIQGQGLNKTNYLKLISTHDQNSFEKSDFCDIPEKEKKIGCDTMTNYIELLTGTFVSLNAD